MKYIFRRIDDTYVVWFAPANRYMHLQEPAFRVFEGWSKELPEDWIIWNCAEEYQLSEARARRFVKEVTSRLQTLISSTIEEKVVACSETCLLPNEQVFSAKYYLINGKTFRIRYGNHELKHMIHPGFSYLENELPESKANHCFDLFQNGDQLFLQVDEKTCWKYPDSKQEYFIGQFYTQLLNCLYQVTDEYWMGAVHASAVSAGKGAVLFTAPSGSGKSTFAAMLMKEGYRVLSDDFSPVSLNVPKVYPFPEGISVKNRSLQALQPYYPSLAQAGNCLPDGVREVFIPVTNGELTEPTDVAAIVFLQYDSTADADFKKLSNLEAMDRFLRELWLPPTSEVAAQFMDWYFQISCYSLKYSNTPKAIASLSKLFEQ